MRKVPSRAAEGEDNQRPPVIVVSGAPGSGKTTYARRLSRDLGLRYFTTGSIFRNLASKLGLSLEELSKRAEEDPSIDISIDISVVSLAMEGGVVIDSHLAAWVLSGIADVSILVKAHPAVRIKRIAKREGRSIDDVIFETTLREASQYKRFLEYYGYDILDYSVFDLIIDTGTLTPDQVYKVIYDFTVSKLSRLGYKVPQH